MHANSKVFFCFLLVVGFWEYHPVELRKKKKEKKRNRAGRIFWDIPGIDHWDFTVLGRGTGIFCGYRYSVALHRLGEGFVWGGGCLALGRGGVVLAGGGPPSRLACLEEQENTRRGMAPGRDFVVEWIWFFFLLFDSIDPFGRVMQQ